MALHPKRKPRDGMDEYGRSPLWNAVAEEDMSLAAELIRQGADINMQDDGGTTPLFMAVQNKHVEMLVLLLTHGANPNVTDKYNHTPLSRALYETRGNPDLDAEVMEILIKHGAKNEPTIANEAKWIVDGEVIPGGTMSPRKMAVIELLAKEFTDATPPWKK
jgi:ankyrin repeat protein